MENYENNRNNPLRLDSAKRNNRRIMGVVGHTRRAGFRNLTYIRCNKHLN